MSASYLNPHVKLTAPGIVHAEFDIRNDSPDTWRAAGGFAIGYHLFDAETGTLIVDGARVPIPDLKPGESARVALDFEVPPEDGDYHVVISPMHENVCWYYEQGWPFLLVHA